MLSFRVSHNEGPNVNSIAPFRITVCGIDELSGHCKTGASHVLSILDPDHPVPEAFGRFGEHAKLGLRFHDVIGEDPGMVLPRQADVARILAFGRSLAAPCERLMSRATSVQDPRSGY
jgi:predicted protein tyrosine phosphatase